MLTKSKHIFLIDPIEKLNVHKDSSCFFMSTLKTLGLEVYILFEADLSAHNLSEDHQLLKVYDFNATFEDEKKLKVKKFSLEGSGQYRKIFPGDCLHMRLDPPFDERYLKILWQLTALEHEGIRMINSPLGILSYNEKIFAYHYAKTEFKIPSVLGPSLENAMQFVHKLPDTVTELILKPLDLFQGIGVVKVSRSPAQFEKVFLEKCKEFNNLIVTQPFIPEVTSGELRSIFFQGHEIGTIVKIPKKGEFLANIAMGASYEKSQLTPGLAKECQRLCKILLERGVSWVAFDLLGGKISEVNITCPGLLYEVSQAYEKNLAEEMFKVGLEYNP